MINSFKKIKTKIEGRQISNSLRMKFENILSDKSADEIDKKMEGKRFRKLNQFVNNGQIYKSHSDDDNVNNNNNLNLSSKQRYSIY